MAYTRSRTYGSRNEAGRQPPLTVAYDHDSCTIKKPPLERGGLVINAIVTCKNVQLSKLQGANGDLACTRIFLCLETDPLAINEATNISALQCRRVHEYIVAAFIRSNESETFLAVVKFNCTLFHNAFFHCGNAHQRRAAHSAT